VFNNVLFGWSKAKQLRKYPRSRGKKNFRASDTEKRPNENENLDFKMAKTKAATKGGSKRDKPPPLDQYKKPLIGVALAMLAYQLFRGMVAKEILRVDMTATANELELREVLFGEDPSTGNTNYAVLCYAENAIYPISSVFQDAANDGSAPAEFRVMDCDVPMPGSEEGKTVVGRFKLNKKTRPVVFVSGAIGQPKQVRFACRDSRVVSKQWRFVHTEDGIVIVCIRILCVCFVLSETFAKQ
jgi:hypothetical protein